jgi:hypothetical protein
MTIVSNGKLAKTLLPAILHTTGSHSHMVIGIEEMRIGQPGAIEYHDWKTLIAENPADVAAAAADADRRSARIWRASSTTSGTGGSPRGVMQHHGAILTNVEGCCIVISEDFGWDDEVFLSFLPLSHAYEHTGGQHFPIGLGAQIYYSEGLDKLASNIEEVRPTLMGLCRACSRCCARGSPNRSRNRASSPISCSTARYRSGARRRRASSLDPRSADEPVPQQDLEAEARQAFRRAESRRWFRAGRRSTPRSACSSRASALPSCRAMARPRQRR